MLSRPNEIKIPDLCPILDLQADKIYRVNFLLSDEPSVEHVLRHWSKDFKYFECWNGSCCEYLGKEPMFTALAPALVFITNDEGELITEDINEKTVALRAIKFSEQSYKKYQTMLASIKGNPVDFDCFMMTKEQGKGVAIDAINLIAEGTKIKDKQLLTMWREKARQMTNYFYGKLITNQDKKKVEDDIALKVHEKDVAVSDKDIADAMK